MKQPRPEWIGYGGPAFAIALLVLSAAALIPSPAVPVLVFLALCSGVGLGACFFLQRAWLAEDEELAGSSASRMDLLQSNIRQQIAELDALGDGLDTILFIVDKDGEVSYANGRATETFQFSEAVGKNIRAVTFSNELAELVSRAFATGQAQKAEITFRHPEERIGAAQAWVSPNVPDTGFVAVFDITDLRRLERVRRDFVANVSHELRTPMATVRVMAETLQETEDEPELRARYLAKIIKEVDRLTSITDDLLTLSAAESREATMAPVNFAEVVQTVANQLRSSAVEKGLELRVQTPERAEIQASDTQLTQIVLNLLANAISYTTEGFVNVNLTDLGQDVSLSVQDTGIGISSEHKGRIFERFYRVDKGRSRASGGTGLGLSIVRNMVEAHGGKITVESELHHGSTFTVILPKHRPGVESGP